MTLLLPDTSSPRGAPAPQGGRPRYQRPLTRRGAPPPPSGPAAPLTSASVPSDHSPGRSSASPQPPPAPAAQRRAVTGLRPLPRGGAAKPADPGRPSTSSSSFPAAQRRASATLAAGSRAVPRRGGRAVKRGRIVPPSRLGGPVNCSRRQRAAAAGRLPACPPGAASPAGAAPSAPAPPVVALNTRRGGLLSRRQASWTRRMLPNLRS